VRHDQIAAFDRKIDKERRGLDAYLSALERAKGAEVIASLMRHASEKERLIARLIHDKDELSAISGEGLSAADAAAIAEWATKTRIGLATASHAERRWALDLIQLRGTIGLDPDGMQLGRIHSFRMERLEARIELLRQSSLFK
jgi:hypothetical protein